MFSAAGNANREWEKSPVLHKDLTAKYTFLIYIIPHTGAKSKRKSIENRKKPRIFRQKAVSEHPERHSEATKRCKRGLGLKPKKNAPEIGKLLAIDVKWE